MSEYRETAKFGYFPKKSEGNHTIFVSVRHSDPNHRAKKRGRLCLLPTAFELHFATIVTTVHETILLPDYRLEPLRLILELVERAGVFWFER